MVHWMLWMLPFSNSLKIDSYHSYLRGLLTKSPIWYGVAGSVVRLISLFLMACMCLIWLNMDLFYWRLVLTTSLSLQDVMKCTLLYFTISFWHDMSYKTCWTVVGSFLKILRIQTLFLSIAGNAWLHGILFVDREIYYMLWCSQYCDTMTMGVSLGDKFTLT